MPYVFLSQSHANKDFARKLAADLRNAGHSVWIDEAEINIGDSLIGKITSGIDQVDFVCAILSRDSVTSSWVQMRYMDRSPARVGIANFVQKTLQKLRMARSREKIGGVSIPV